MSGDEDTDAIAEEPDYLFQPTGISHNVGSNTRVRPVYIPSHPSHITRNICEPRPALRNASRSYLRGVEDISWIV